MWKIYTQHKVFIFIFILIRDAGDDEQNFKKKDF